MPASAERVVVVVPAHNEESTLPACLASVLSAATRSPLPVEVVVVLDSCADASPAVVRAFPSVRTVEVDARNVGVARGAGMVSALPGRPVWLMTTDADSLVPPHWIAGHLAHAYRGADIVVGTVTAVDWREWPPGLAEVYHRRYATKVHPQGQGHGHVHGANLGLSGRAYLAAGGFGPLATAEDRALVNAARAAGLHVLSVTDVPVVTSTRAVSRAPQGFSDHLRRLVAEEPVA